MTRITADNAFEAAHAHVAKWEGGLTDHPSDPGGITNFGISLRFLQDLVPTATADDIRAMTAEGAKQLMKQAFWDNPGADRLPPLVAVAFYDLAVNAGCRRSILLMQDALDVAADGVIGPATLQTLAECDQEAIALRMLSAREAWYRRLVSKKESSRVFLRGWLNRTESCRKLIVRLAAEWGLA